MTALRIARDLALPLDAVTQAIGILARRGAGKTYTATVLVEEVVSAGLPVVVLDPTGAWWGLRSSADGTKAGLPVVILGGQHADVPLERSAGKVIADVVVEHPGAYVLDLSGFESKTSEQTFAADFLERLYRAKATHQDALLVVVDEADLFAPQRPGPEQTRTLGALEAIVRRGRIRGLGVVLISQRAAVLNKNVLTQIEVLVAMQTTGPQDRAAIDEWIKGNGTPEERELVLGSLASLERGEAWVWSPSWLRILQRIRIRQRRTYDSSRTPEAGETLVTPQAFAKVDLDALGERIAATIEKGKADDPKELRRRIHELEREIVARPTIQVPPEVREVRVPFEVPVLNGETGQLIAAIRELREATAPLAVVAERLITVGDTIAHAIDRVQSAGSPQPVRAPRAVAVAERPRIAAPPVPRQREERSEAADGAPSLDRAQRALLTALAQFPEGLTKVRLSLVSGYSIKSSSFANALGALRSAGLVDRGGEPIRATDAGIAAVPDAPRPPTTDELLRYWTSRLGKAERSLLETIVSQHPTELTKAELSELSGYSLTSSSFANAIGALRSLGLVEKGTLRATEDLGL